MTDANSTSDENKTPITKHHIQGALDTYYNKDHEDKGLVERMRLVLEEFLKQGLI